jgi:hypothetical protein
MIVSNNFRSGSYDSGLLNSFWVLSEFCNQERLKPRDHRRGFDGAPQARGSVGQNAALVEPGNVLTKPS